jgi:hypothetical protein
VNKEIWDVFQERESRSYLANDPDCFRPEISFVVISSLIPRDAEWLTWEARRDNIHASSPGTPVERLNITPYRRIAQTAISNPCFNDFDAIGVVFNVADGRPSKEDASEQPSTPSGK